MGRNRGVGESSLQILKLGCSSVLSTYFVISSTTALTFTTSTSTTTSTTPIPGTTCDMNYHSSLYHDNCHNITVDNSDKASIVVNT
jgi:hypothetical protein